MVQRVVKKLQVKLHYLVIIFIVVGLIAICIGLCFLYYSYKLNKEKLELEKHEKFVKKKENVKKKNAIKEYNFSMIMVGDALIHSSLYIDAKLDNGGYDFKPMLQYIKPLLADYDIKYYNQETILGGVELGLSNYPRFNSPYEVGDAFVDAGFNLVSLATNHTMDKGEVGVINSKTYWNSKTDVITAGSYLSEEERQNSKIYEKNGINYAFFSYTIWNNGLSTPSNKEYLNNEYSFDKAKADIEKVSEKSDVIIVAMHWGDEYSHDVSVRQEEIAYELSSLGVNIIIGTHPHVVEPIEYINDGKTLVIYSLGNFISDQIGIERLSGLMVSLNVKKIIEKQISTISVENVKATLLYTYSNRWPRNFRVYPYIQLDDSMLPNYLSYYENYKNIVKSRYLDLQFNE